MDNWGDPWADNADSTVKSPTKDAVTSAPTAFAAAPTILGGFLDDAGWGNEDENFGDWSTATSEHVKPPPSPPTERNFTAPTAHSPGDTSWDAIDANHKNATHSEGNWADVRLDAHKDEDHVVSESSDASTTVQANDATGSTTSLASTGPSKADDSSARTSTSPSEASHNDTQVESPRTSYEEERGAVKASTVEEHGSAARSLGADKPIADASEPQGQQEAEKDEDDLCSTSVSSQSLAAPPSSTSVTRAAYPIDSDLLARLFTPQKEGEQPDESPDDPIYSTEARKAWYRLTRKQTMREFNNGNHDDNHVRVTWTNSQIRSEVNKIVARWARDDRISGTGPGARASFYWDTSVPIDPKPMANHIRQKSSMHIASTTTPMQEPHPPPLTTNVPAAFSWSSATTSADPWQQASPGLRSSSPIAPIPSAVVQLQKQEGRAVSLDLTSRAPETAKHARNLTATNETPIVANLISPPISDTNTTPQPWTGLDLFDNNAIHKDVAAAPVAPDDEDDWGEMVSSPTVSTPTLTRPTSRVDTRDNTLSTSATTPQSVKSVILCDQSPDAMHATPIVRLKSTISPTSALFKPNPFVPMRVEQGPIGPGLLKSSKRAVSNSRRLEAVSVPKVESDSKLAKDSEQPPPGNPSDDLSACHTPLPEVDGVQPTPAPVAVNVQETLRPSTPPQHLIAAPPQHSDVDAWADADFSFFESPTVAPALVSKLDPSDPFPMVEGRERSTSAASSAKTFTRSPPRKVPTPPVQPLTGATSSAQRRKMEEDAIVQGILSGLPDLSYMLR